MKLALFLSLNYFTFSNKEWLGLGPSAQARAPKWLFTIMPKWSIVQYFTNKFNLKLTYTTPLDQETHLYSWGTRLGVRHHPLEFQHNGKKPFRSSRFGSQDQPGMVFVSIYYATLMLLECCRKLGLQATLAQNQNLTLLLQTLVFQPAG